MAGREEGGRAVRPKLRWRDEAGEGGLRSSGKKDRKGEQTRILKGVRRRGGLSLRCLGRKCRRRPSRWWWRMKRERECRAEERLDRNPSPFRRRDVRERLRRLALLWVGWISKQEGESERGEVDETGREGERRGDGLKAAAPPALW